MRLPFVLMAAFAACASPSSRQPSPPVTTFRGLLDSLASASDCPGAKLPPVSLVQPLTPAPVSFTTTEQCGVVRAAIRRLGREAPAEPFWAPQDTARILGATVFGAVMTEVDTNGVIISPPDTLARVELDVPGRPKIIWFTYSLAPGRERMGAVHRGPL
jgi:hypothetical protein